MTPERHEVASELHRSSADTYLQSDRSTLATPPGTAPISPIQRVTRHPFRMMVLLVSLVPIVTALVTARAVWLYGGHEQFVGWSIGWDGAVVSEVVPGGPADGKLQPGDRIVRINGDDRVGAFGALWKLRFLQPGRPYSLDIERRGDRHHIIADFQIRPVWWRPVLIVRLFGALVWTAFALFIGLSRPEMRAARLISLMGLIVATVIMRAVMLPLMPLMDEASTAYYGILMAITGLPAILTFHGLYHFPSGSQPGRLWSLALAAAYVTTAVLLLHFAVDGSKYFADPAVALWLIQAGHSIIPLDGSTQTVFENASVATIGALGLAVALRNYRAVRDGEAKRRVRWIIASVTVAVSAVIVNAITVSRFNLVNDAVTELSTAIVPIVFAYAIVRHRVFDISVVVRQSVQYLLARGALRTLVALPLAAMLVMLAMNPNVTVRQLVLEHPEYPLLAIAAAGALAVRQRLARAIDRRFFRDAHDRERLLESIFEDIEALERTEDGFKQVAERLAAALHPRYVTIWLCSPGDESLRPLHSVGTAAVAASDTWRVPSALVHDLEHDSEVRRLESLWRARDLGNLRRFVVDGSSGVLIPIVGQDERLRGVLMLGAKRSEEAYPPADLRLLRRIARQMGVVQEHAELRSRVGEAQRVHAEVLSKLTPGQFALMKECPRCGACYDGAQDHCDADGTELTFTLPVERVIASRYRLERLIARGGMGTVYDALDTRLQRSVAVKILLGRHFGDEQALRRFDREARAVARLSHPNIIAVFDYGSLAHEGAFLVMERVHGRSMRSELAGASSPMARRLGWIQPMLDGVAAAHAHGVIHRDLKPENILVATATPGPDVVKLLDFGLAKVRLDPGHATTTVTAAGHILGTMSYMAPEQLLGETVDERSDIFALGVIIFEIMSGRRPFPDDALARLSAVRDGLPSLPASHAGAQRVLLKCTALYPAARYRSVTAMREDLLPLLEL